MYQIWINFLGILIIIIIDIIIIIIIICLFLFFVFVLNTLITSGLRRLETVRWWEYQAVGTYIS